jgi:serine phosphatase RsbU (regulator of sigma subunit)
MGSDAERDVSPAAGEGTMPPDLEGRLAEADRRLDSLTRNLLECYEELDLIYRLSRGLMSTFDAQKNVTLVLDEAMEIFEADMGWVAPYPGTRVFEAVATRAPSGLKELLDEALVNRLAREKRSQVLYSLRSELGLDHPEAPDTFLFAVLKTESGEFGCLCLGRRPGAEIFTAGDLKLASVLASQAAVALENGRLHRQHRKEEERMIRLEEEFRLARSIQGNLLPKDVPTVPGYELAGGTVPAQSVGGDYYDFIPMDRARLALCLGDVSGKGMPAALLMAHLQATIRGQALLGTQPGQCLWHSNRLLFHSTDLERFATCFYGVLDLEEHRLCYANAGHEHPLHFRGNGKPVPLDQGGIVLGILEGAEYGDATLPIAPGDLIVVYSDGITDASDRNGEPFGVERLVRLVNEHVNESAPKLLERILDTVRTHAGDEPQLDDMTLTVVRRLPA